MKSNSELAPEHVKRSMALADLQERVKEIDMNSITEDEIEKLFAESADY